MGVSETPKVVISKERLEVGRSVVRQCLLLSVVGAEGHEPKATTVLKSRCVDRIAVRDDRLGCTVLWDNRPSEVLNKNPWVPIPRGSESCDSAPPHSS